MTETKIAARLNKSVVYTAYLNDFHVEVDDDDVVVPELLQHLRGQYEGGRRHLPHALLE